MPKRLCALAALLAVFLLFGSSCEVTEPDRVIRSPVIKSFAPGAPYLDVLVGDTLRFSITAVDPDDGGLEFFFTLGDSIVSSDDIWEYVVDDTGLVEVRGYASNGHSESFVTWDLYRTQPDNLPPIIVEVHPRDANPSIIVGNSVEFTVSAIDPEGKVLGYAFTVDDSIVAAINHFTYYPSKIGPVAVRAIVSDGESFVSHRWSLTVNAEPDSLPPGVVMLQSLVTGVNPGELVVEWIAVGGDGMEGLPTHYQVRTSSNRIEDAHSWETASERDGAPAPAPPGEVQQMVVRDLKPAKIVYVGVRAVDAFGNLSPLGNTLGEVTKGMLVTGTVRDAITGDPIPGIHVRLVGVEDISADDGSYQLEELPDAITNLHATDESGTEIGAYYNRMTDLYAIQHNDVFDVWMMPNVDIQSTIYPTFLNFVRRMAAAQGLGDHLNTWDFPVKIWVPPFAGDGLDVAAFIIEAVAEWESAAGVDFFEFVDALPAVGISVKYDRAEDDRENFEIVEADENNLYVQGIIHMRRHYDPSLIIVLQKIAAHELGHSLGMLHSSDEAHLMIGGRVPAVSTPTQAEIWLSLFMYHVPRGTNLAGFLED